MSAFTEKVERDKKEYLSMLQDQKEQYDHLVIYGAGRIAKPLYLFLKDHGFDVEAFCVTDKTSNKREEEHIPIIQIDELPFDQERTLVLFGVNPRLNKEVRETLEKNGFQHYVQANEYLRYYGDYQNEFFMSPMMEISTKAGCAVNCKYCPQEVYLKNYFKTGKEVSMMSLDTFKTCLDKTPQNMYVEFAGFTEPFFNPACTEMILYAFGTGRKVNLFTTLRGMTRDDLEKLKNVEFEEFVLHVPDVEKYADIPITPEYLELLKEVIDAKMPSGKNLVSYACSQGTVPEIVKQYLEGKARIFVSLFDRAGNLDDPKLIGKHGIKGKIRCELSQKLNHNVLLPDGRVVLCSMDFGMKHVLGNLLEQDYEQVVNGAEAQRLYQCMADPHNTDILCRECNLAQNIDFSESDKGEEQ